MAIIRTSIQICPVCQSENLTPWAGGLSGEMLCKECGYHGALIIEKSIEGGEDRIAGLGPRKDGAEAPARKAAKKPAKKKGKHK